MSTASDSPVHELRSELKSLIVEALKLEDVRPEQIDDEAPLFGGELGLDSLDALEIVVALEYKYGFKVNLDSEQGKAFFANIAALSEYVASKRKK